MDHTVIMTFPFRVLPTLTLPFALIPPVLHLGCAGTRGGERGAPAPTAAQGVRSLGRIVPGQRVIHVSGPTGVIKEVLVLRQDLVRKGQVLALMLDHDSAAAALAQAAREVEVAANLLAQARAGEKAGTLAAQRALAASASAGLDNARASHARIKALFDQGIVARADLDQAQLLLVQAQESLRAEQERYRSLTDVRPVDLAVLDSRLRSALAAQGKAQAALDLSEIRAPFAGQVLDIHAFPGEAVGVGGILDLGDTADMMVEAEVDILDIARVRKGSQARISSEGLAAETTGKVEEIYGTVAANAVIDPQPLSNADLRVVKVRIRLDHPETCARLVNALVTVTFPP
jgi:HlyD family secretion protein